MYIFKFGGASVKDAQGVQNVVKVLNTVGYDNTLIVVSAMGKTTNKLELVVKHYFEKSEELTQTLTNIKTCHEEILIELFPKKTHPVYNAVANLLEELNGFLKWNKSPNYSFVYDQVVCYGELISTTIISHYLTAVGITNNWIDARNIIKTDTSYRDAKVNWEKTHQCIGETVQKDKLTITQGFIGSDNNNFTTTLGREGSDYSAAIFAYCLGAKNVTIWKDVPGVLNADPRYFKDTELLNQISYEEAIELAFYGASVIHPKTLQPLQRKEIPLYVKCFLNPKEKGTTVSKGKILEPMIPCFIVKKNQVLISLSSLDFSFIMEDSISTVFSLIHHYKLKVDVIQNSAISFSVCVHDKYQNIDKLIHELKATFKVNCHKNVDLYTIRHFNEKALSKVAQQHKVLLKQENKGTVQLIIPAS